MSAGLRTLAVCADDFGAGAAIDDGILALAGRGRLSALTCLTGGAGWATSAPRLAALPAAVQRGLHFNLSEGAPASRELRRHWAVLPTLPRLIAAAHLSALPLPAIAAEWRTQWQRFADASGSLPQFVDGHQHVHHLPGVREIVLQAAQDAGVAVRNTGRVTGPGHAAKRWLIVHTGGSALMAALQARGLRHNAVLCGVYDFQADDYRRLVQGWLAALPAAGGLLFCHPAAARPDRAPDPIAAARRREAAYLGSEAFAEDLAAASVRLGPAWPQRSSGG